VEYPARDGCFLEPFATFAARNASLRGSIPDVRKETTSLEVTTPPPHDPDPRLMGKEEDERASVFYRRMRFIRRFEEILLELFEDGVLNGTTHASIGQEADSVGVLSHLEPGDHVFSNHRCHGHYLMQSQGDAYGLLAEIMGKPGGVCHGKGGSQHIAGPGFKSNGILGGTVPTAAGIALGLKLGHREGSLRPVSVVFMGDGTLGEGVVYETLNIASLWELPLLLVVENNEWSQSTPIAANLAGTIPARFEAFGIETRAISTTDVMEIDEAARDALRSVRETGRPFALVIGTYRLCHHSKSSDGRPEEEVAARWPREPLAIHGARLPAEVRTAIDREVEEALFAVVERVKSG